MIRLALTILFSFYITTSFSQSIKPNSLELFIRQESYPGPFPALEYQIKHQKLKVFRNDNWKKIKIGNRKLLYKSRLNDEFITTLDSLIVSLNIKVLSNKFSGYSMDGTTWTITVNSGQLNKQIVVSNCYLEELFQILKTVNMRIPNEVIKINNYCLGQKDDCNCKKSYR